jgi:hypothetical protein
VTDIEPHAVTLSDGTVLEFDHLVVATGSKYELPFTSPFMINVLDLEQVRKGQELLKTANNIVVIGGGPVSLEVVGEIAHRLCPEGRISPSLSLLLSSSPLPPLYFHLSLLTSLSLHLSLPSLPLPSLHFPSPGGLQINKKITLVSSSAILMERSTKIKAHESCMDFLLSRGVEVILGEKALGRVTSSSDSLTLLASLLTSLHTLPLSFSLLLTSHLPLL